MDKSFEFESLKSDIDKVKSAENIDSNLQFERAYRFYLKMLKESELFGLCKAYLYTVDFDKLTDDNKKVYNKIKSDSPRLFNW